jgi:RNA polymerase sigma-70 factor (ECF subfamily)
MVRMRTHAKQTQERRSNSPRETVQGQVFSQSDEAKKMAVEQTWNEFSTRLSQFIRARVADPLTAEDILQDVFVKFQGRFAEFHDPAKIQGWLFLVARNAIIDHYRTRKATSKLSESLPVEPAEIDVTEMEELHVIFRQIINRLPERYREAVVLTTFEGLTQEELAKRLEISVSGAKSRVQRGREQLKELLLDFCRREFSRTVGCQPCPHGLFPIVTATKPVAKQKPAPRRPGKSKQ